MWATDVGNGCCHGCSGWFCLLSDNTRGFSRGDALGVEKERKKEFKREKDDCRE